MCFFILGAGRAVNVLVPYMYKIIGWFNFISLLCSFVYMTNILPHFSQKKAKEIPVLFCDSSGFSLSVLVFFFFEEVLHLYPGIPVITKNQYLV